MKAVITDLDRTLLRSDKTVSAYTLSVLDHCRRRGIRLICATARPERAVLEYHEQIQFDAMILTNGARILLRDRVIENGIPHEKGTQILRALCTVPNTVISVEMGDGLYANTPIPLWNPILHTGFPALPSESILYKILASGNTEVLLHTVEALRAEDVYHTLSEGSLLQIMSRQAAKWNGIRTVLDNFGISPADAVYFGDDEDDIEPMLQCGLGIAVENAIASVKSAADFVTGTNDGDGVARYIEKKLL